MGIDSPALSLVLTSSDEHSELEAAAYLARFYGALDGIETLVVLQGRDRAEGPQGPGRWIRVRNPGRPNRAWGWNLGAREAAAPVLVFVDCGVVVLPEALRKAAGLCLGQAVAANLFSRLAQLDAAATGRLLAGEEAPRFEGPDTTPVGGFCTGGFAIQAAAFQRLGGFDERVFGAENGLRLMERKLRGSDGLLASFDNVTALRLHDTAEGSTDDPELVGRLQVELDTPPAAFAFRCEVQRQLMGNSEKYDYA